MPAGFASIADRIMWSFFGFRVILFMSICALASGHSLLQSGHYLDTLIVDEVPVDTFSLMASYGKFLRHTKSFASVERLEGTLCPVLVSGSMRHSLEAHMRISVGSTSLAAGALEELERQCQNSTLLDAQRLQGLHTYLDEHSFHQGWQEFAHPDHGSATTALLRKLLPSGDPQRVLDYGAGDCTDLAAVAKELSIGKQDALGVDISPEGPASENSDAVTYIRLEEPLAVDLRKLGERLNGTVDVAWSFVVLHHVPDPLLQPVLQALAKSLKVGGTLLIQEWTLPEAMGKPREDKAIMFDWIHLLNGVIFSVGGDKGKADEPAVPHEIGSIGTQYRSLPEWIKAVESAGFSLDRERSATARNGTTLEVQASQGIVGGIAAVFKKL